MPSTNRSSSRWFRRSGQTLPRPRWRRSRTSSSRGALGQPPQRSLQLPRWPPAPHRATGHAAGTALWPSSRAPSVRVGVPSINNLCSRNVSIRTAPVRSPLRTRCALPVKSHASRKREGPCARLMQVNRFNAAPSIGSETSQRYASIRVFGGRDPEECRGHGRSQ
jgi:hypothetical protein